MRLIDADALLENYGLKDAVKYDENGYVKRSSYGTLMLYEIHGMIEDAPTVDAVEVVRCKDCVHWFGECDDGQEHSCDMDALLRPANHFCGYGERKEST